ncbi:MAG: threonine synthase [Candidatus Thorarchaeota archaeon]
MKFHSTNYNSSEVDLKTAILQGQALDNGLYMLNEIPKLSERTLGSLKSFSFTDIASQILSQFIENLIPDKILRKIIKDAFNFDVPVEKVANNDYICYLDRGPTCSFKDFGARMLARIMEYFLEEENKSALILTATSGDTGGAVAQAFFKMKSIKVVVLYPQNEVSILQRKQITTLGNNISAIGIKGKFDDCQKLVKLAFSDQDLSYLNLSSANSINIGRLLPQILYYFWSYYRIIENYGEKVIFSVPSGNFGNLTGGLIAYKMGLPVEKFISAVNENDEFPSFLITGSYSKLEPSKNCISNAMNVGHPSNLARIIDMYGGRMDENGVINKVPSMETLRKDIISYSINDELTRTTISNFYQNYHKIIEPHGAVGWAALKLLRKNFPNFNSIKSIVFETAHPSKFSTEVISLTNQNPVLPKSLKVINESSEIRNPIGINTYQDFKNYLIKNYGF